jgi:hypothetical protein
VTILDHVDGSFDRVVFCLPIDPAWQVELGASTARATCESTNGESALARIDIELAGCFEWSLERRFYYPTFGREVERFVLVGRVDGSRFEPATTRFRRLDTGQ